MSKFADLLVSDKPEKNLDLYGRFVGEWDFVWYNPQDNSDEKVKGEWIFSYVLQGTAVQDLFICPSVAERKANPRDYMEYGTTIRFPLNDGSDKWHILYASDNGHKADRLIAEEIDGDIIQTGINYDSEDTTLWQWNFRNITADYFRWECRYSKDMGETWIYTGRIEAVRRK